MTNSCCDHNSMAFKPLSVVVMWQDMSGFNIPFLLCMWLEETACLRVGSVQVNSTSVGVVWFSELAKLASLRPLHKDSSEKVRCKVRLGDCKEKKRERSESSTNGDWSLTRWITRAGVFLTGSLWGISPGLSMMMSFFRSSSMVLLYVLRGERRSLSDARSRGCPNTFFEFVSTCLETQDMDIRGMWFCFWHWLISTKPKLRVSVLLLVVVVVRAGCCGGVWRRWAVVFSLPRLLSALPI